jgi:hypothetical protein
MSVMLLLPGPAPGFFFRLSALHEAADAFGCFDALGQRRDQGQAHAAGARVVAIHFARQV